jgi:hypothetical protein
VPASGCIGGGIGPTRIRCSSQHSIQVLVYALLKTLSFPAAAPQYNSKQYQCPPHGHACYVPAQLQGC